MELARNLRKDPVSRLEPTEPLSVDKHSTVGEAVLLMRGANAGGVLVCDEGQLIGIFTERDLIRRVLAVGKPLRLPIVDVMTPDPLTIRSSDPIRLAVRRMEGKGHRHLPIVDDDKRPVGMLSIKRLVRYLVEHYPQAVYNQPPSGQPPETAEGA